MKVGKYALFEPVEYKFKEEPDLWWKIKPPTSGDELDIARFLNRGKYVVSTEGASREDAPTWIEIMHREIALTFAGTNIADDNDKPVLKENASVSGIEKVLKQLPHAMVLELWEAIAEYCPGWGGKKQEGSEEDPNLERPETSSQSMNN